VKAFRVRSIKNLEETMRKLMLMLAATAAILFAGALTWNAEASVTGGSGNLAITAKNFTPIIKTACGGPGAHCRWGRHWVCGPMGRCWCAPC
jgi:hypothetical protein